MIRTISMTFFIFGFFLFFTSHFSISEIFQFIFTKQSFSRPKINRDITIEVQSTESLRYLSYQVIGRGDIIVTNSVEIPNRKSHTITFLASFAMVPKAQFIVHYIHENEIISDKLDIDLGEDLQNFVSVSFLV